MLKLRLGRKRVILIITAMIVFISAIVTIIIYIKSKDGESDSGSRKIYTLDEIIAEGLKDESQKISYDVTQASRLFDQKKVSESEAKLAEIKNKYQSAEQDLGFMTLQARIYMRNGKYDLAVQVAEKILASDSMKNNVDAVREWTKFISSAKANTDITATTASDAAARGVE